MPRDSRSGGEKTHKQLLCSSPVNTTNAKVFFYYNRKYDPIVHQHLSLITRPKNILRIDRRYADPKTGWAGGPIPSSNHAAGREKREKKREREREIGADTL